MFKFSYFYTALLKLPSTYTYLDISYEMFIFFKVWVFYVIEIFESVNIDDDSVELNFQEK